MSHPRLRAGTQHHVGIARHAACGDWRVVFRRQSPGGRMSFKVEFSGQRRGRDQDQGDGPAGPRRTSGVLDEPRREDSESLARSEVATGCPGWWRTIDPAVANAVPAVLDRRPERRRARVCAGGGGVCRRGDRLCRDDDLPARRMALVMPALIVPWRVRFADISKTAAKVAVGGAIAVIVGFFAGTCVMALIKCGWPW